MAAQEALFEERISRSVAAKALTEEKGARQTAEQALKTSDEAKTKLS
jgi:hypothetical protein